MKPGASDVHACYSLDLLVFVLICMLRLILILGGLTSAHVLALINTLANLWGPYLEEIQIPSFPSPERNPKLSVVPLLLRGPK